MHSLNPILLASPTQRSGTTLLQRLLCSADNTLIYGEFCAHELSMATQMYLLKQSQFSMGLSQRKVQMEKVLSGEVNDWIPDLMPEPEKWIETIGKGSFLQFEYMKRFALNHERPVWGMKMAGWDPHSLHQIMGLLPESRLIYLIRDVEACLRSAIAIDIIRGEEEIQQFRQVWKYNHATTRQLIHSHRVLYLDFESLMTTPLDVIKQLELFSGASQIKQDVLNKKINNEGTYLKPS